MLAIAIGLFELTQDLVRARLIAVTVMKATLVRATSRAWPGRGLRACQTDRIPAAGFVRAGLSARGAGPVAHGLARHILKFDGAGLAGRWQAGLPLTISLTLLAISSVTDRFMIANLVGAADAGKYVAGLDLVRQTLMMPAMSAAAAFFPLAVQIHASQGDGRGAIASGECAELLFSITLPACLGFAVISAHIANVVLGVDFREIAAQIMPIIAVAVIFQILTQQYLHASFLLSGRNSFYLINTASIIAANVILSYVLISKYGTVGAAWARLGADVFGFACALVLSRLAFPIPIPLGRLALTHDRRIDDGADGRSARQSLHVSDLTACVVLACAGFASYAALCWLFDISRIRGA